MSNVYSTTTTEFHWDASMATKPNTFRLYITANAGVENVNFGYGELFPQ